MDALSGGEKKKKEGEKRVRNDVRREGREEKESGLENERGGDMVLRKKIFSAVACIMNEGALCLKLQPQRFTSRFAGQSGAL